MLGDGEIELYKDPAGRDGTTENTFAVASSPLVPAIVGTASQREVGIWSHQKRGSHDASFVFRFSLQQYKDSETLSRSD
jgi:hypothetical protein